MYQVIQKSLFMILTFIVFLSGQDYPRFNEIKMQPEVWQFEGPVDAGVDAKGDLSFSIPILSVPGTNGLDFQISFSYKAGILYNQTASWVGLGWNFNPGSITRDVIGNVKIGTTPYTVDYAMDPSTYKYMPDKFFLTLPGKGTSRMFYTMDGFNSYESDSYKHPYNGAFNLADYQPYKVDITADSLGQYPWPTDDLGTAKEPDQGDIIKFVITTDDGFKYIFGLPSVATFTTYVNSQSLPKYYPNVWRLLAIVGPEFEGDYGFLLQGPEQMPSGADFYNRPEHNGQRQWIKFEYAFDNSKLFSYRETSGYNIIENTYLRYIITPTHFAKFNVGPRHDIDLLSGPSEDSIDKTPYYKSLSNIELYTKDNILVKKIQLSQDYNIAQATPGTGNGKLRLSALRFFSHSGEEMPGYNFEYINNAPWINDSYWHYYDGLGYYNTQGLGVMETDDDKTDAQEWSLKKIIFPTGGWQEFQYENDHIADSALDYIYVDSDGIERTNTFSFNNRHHQGGVRVTQKTTYDAMGNYKRINYSYGPGHVASIPAKALPFENQGPTIYANEFITNNRGEADVVYEWVKRKYSSNKTSSEKSGAYDVSYYEIGDIINNLFFRRSRQLLYRLVVRWNWIVDERHLYLGLPWNTLKRKEVYDQSGFVTTTNYYYNSNKQLAAIMMPPGDPVTDEFDLFQLAPRVIQKFTKKSDFMVSQETQTNISYIPQTLQIRKKEVIGAEERFTTQNTYAYEIADYGGTTWNPNALQGMRRLNDLNKVAKIEKYYSNKKHPVYGPGDISVTAPHDGEDRQDFYVEQAGPVKWKSKLQTFVKFNTSIGGVASFKIIDANGTIIVSKVMFNDGSFAATKIDSGSFNAQANMIYTAIASTDFSNADNDVELYSHGDVFHVIPSPLSPVLFLSDASITTYSEDTSAAVNAWRTKKQYQLNTLDTLFVAPDFSSWTTPSPLDSLWQEKTDVLEYFYGKPSKIADAKGNITYLYYGDNTSPLTNSESGQFYNELLTGIRLNGLTKKFLYDSLFYQVREIWDENGKKNSFQYDSFGRLYRLYNNAGSLIAKNRYYFSRNSSNNFTYNPVIPNKVITTLYKSTNSDSMTNVSYFDGLALPLQTINILNNSEIINVSEKDIYGRDYKTYNAYSLPGQNTGAYDPDFESTQGDDYILSYAISDLNNEYSSVHFQGNKTQYWNSNSFDYDKKYAWLVDNAYSSKDSILWNVKIKTDENSYKINTYTDIFGKKRFEEKATAFDSLQDFSQAVLKVAGTVRDTSIFTVKTDQTVTWVANFNHSSNAVAGLLSFSIVDHTSNDYVIASQSDTPPLPNNQKEYTGSFNASTQNIYYIIKEVQKMETDGIASSSSVKLNYLESNMAIKTAYEYDANSNLIRVKHPNYFDPPAGSDSTDWITKYKYNTLGQLMATVIPDRDGNNNGDPADETLSSPDVRYKYDANGNLRFSQDANRMQKGQVLFSSYDAFDRVTKSGVASISSWNSLDANATYSFETDSAIVISSYDGADAYSGAQNLKGRVSRIKYKTGSGWGYVWYSYTPEGWVEWMVTDVYNVGQKKTEYEYDLQGNIIKMVYDRNGNDSFFQWQIYDALGRLSKVKVNTTNSEPAQAKAVYSYWPGGQVKKLSLNEQGNGGFMEVLDYKYNERNWLTSINAPSNIYDASNNGNSFGMRLYYGSGSGATFTPQYNGNIAAAEYYTKRDGYSEDNATGSFYHRYEYGYDGASRIKNANYYYDSGAIWESAGNPFKLYNINYDNMGNFQTLSRNNESGTSKTYNYNYYSGSSRLKNTDGSGSDYTYDANGNVTSDVNKGVSQVDYDYRNLPTRVTFTNGDIIEYAYNHEGNRVYKKYTPAGSAYASSGSYYIYDAQGRTLAVYDLDGQLKFINLYGLDLIGKIF